MYLFNKWAGKTPQERLPAEQIVIRTLESLPDVPLYFSEVTLGELHYGIARSSRKAQNPAKWVWLTRLLVPLPVTEAVWKLFGETLAYLPQQGKPIADRDLLIACTAKVSEVTLVTNDHDFDNLPTSFRKTNWISG